MLYNIISPLIFFGSLGGIILVASRIIVRRRRREQAADVVRMGKQVTPAQATRSLRPPQNRIHLATNQVSVILESARQLFRWPWHPPKIRLGVHQAVRRAGSISQKGKTQVLSMVRAGGQLLARRQKTRQQRQSEKAVEEVPVPPPAPPKVIVAPTTSSQKADPKPSRIRQVKAQVVSPLFFKKSSPSSPVRLATEALSQEKYQEVEQILVPYLMRHSKDTEAYLLLGKAVLKQRNWKDAMEAFEQVIALKKNEPAALKGLGLAAFRAGHYAKALPALQRALDTNPHDKVVIKCLLHIARTMDNPALQRSIARTLTEVEKTSPAPAK